MISLSNSNSHVRTCYNELACSVNNPGHNSDDQGRITPSSFYQVFQ